MTAGFEDGDEPVEIRSGVRAGNDDANWMKKFFTLCSGFGFHFVDNFFELLERQMACLCRFVGQNLDSEPGEYGTGIWPGENLGVIRRGQRSLGVIVEN